MTEIADEMNNLGGQLYMGHPANERTGANGRGM